MKKIDWPSNQTLIRWYHGEGWSQADIARKVGCDPSSVSRKLQEEGIRSRGQFKQWPDPEKIRRMYWEEGMSTTEIADEIGRGSSGVASFMDRHDIPRRGRYEACDYDRIDWPDEDTLVTWYEQDMLTTAEIAERLDCTRGSVSQRLESIGVDLRGIGWIELSKTDSRFALYTRWALGETQREFGDRLGVSFTTVRYWERNLGNVRRENVETWQEVVRLGEREGISQSHPRRLLYPHQAVDALGELMYVLDTDAQGLGEELGVGEAAVHNWLDRRTRPLVGMHYQIRKLAEIHGVWTPPDTGPDEEEDEQVQHDGSDLSDHDHATIQQLYQDGTAATDLAMMYGVTLQVISDIVR